MPRVSVTTYSFPACSGLVGFNAKRRADTVPSSARIAADTLSSPVPDPTGLESRNVFSFTLATFTASDSSISTSTSVATPPAIRSGVILSRFGIGSSTKRSPVPNSSFTLPVNTS